MEENIKKADNSGTIALILGILSIVFAVIGLGVIGAILGIIGIVQGNKMRKTDKEANAGFVCSIVGTALSSFFAILILFLTLSFTSLFSFTFLPMLFW